MVCKLYSDLVYGDRKAFKDFKKENLYFIIFPVRDVFQCVALTLTLNNLEILPAHDPFRNVKKKLN